MGKAAPIDPRQRPAVETDLNRRASLLFMLAGLAVFGPRPATAGFPYDVPDRYQLAIGGTLATIGSGAALGLNSGGASAMLSFEDFFNLPVHKQYLTADGSWKFGRVHYLDLGYVNIDRTAQRQISSDLEFGRYTFHPGVLLEAGFASRFIYASYRHDFLQLEQVRLSGSAGVSVVRMAAQLSGEGNITDENGQPVTGQASGEAKFPLPVPLLGFQMDWALSRRGAIQAYVRAFGLDYSGIRGSMTQSTLRYNWYFARNVGLGVGYDQISINLAKYRTDDYTARFNYSIQGLSLYLRGAY